MERSLKVLLIFFFTWVTAQSQITFQRGIGRIYPPCGQDNISSITQSFDSGYVLAGTLLLDPNSNFFSWAKADSLGNYIWTNNAGSSWQSHANSIALTSDSGFILCGQAYNGNDRYVLVIKTNSNGIISWHQTLHGTWEQNAFSIIECYDGGFILVGQTEVGIWNKDILIAKLNTNGFLLWSRYYSGIYSDDGAYSITQDSDSGFILCGTSYDIQHVALMIKVDSIGNIMWSKNYSSNNIMGATCIKKTFDGGFIFSGYDVSNWPNDHSFIIKTDATGDTLWTKQFITTVPMVIRSVDQTRDSGYILSGSLGPQAGTKAILLRLDSSGNMIWSKAYYTNTGPQSGIGSFETSDGGFIIGCERSFYLIKTDSVGSSCGSFNPTIQMISGNQINISSPAFLDSSNVLTVFNEFFGSSGCDTVANDECLPLSLYEYKDDNLSISLFPNPAADFINIESENEVLSVEIFNSIGEKYLRKIIGLKSFQLGISDLQPGAYSIKCMTKSGYSCHLFLKQ